MQYVTPIEEHNYETSLIETILEKIALAQRLKEPRPPVDEGGAAASVAVDKFMADFDGTDQGLLWPHCGRHLLE